MPCPPQFTDGVHRLQLGMDGRESFQCSNGDQVACHVTQREEGHARLDEIRDIEDMIICGINAVICRIHPMLLDQLQTVGGGWRS